MLVRALARSAVAPIRATPAGARGFASTSAWSQSHSSSASSTTTRGAFLRPREAPANGGLRSAQPREARPAVAEPHTPPHVTGEQSPNYPSTWSAGQNTRDNAMRGPRFEQTAVDFQPQPLSAMEMIQREPIRLVESRIVSCDGGE